MKHIAGSYMYICFKTFISRKIKFDHRNYEYSAARSFKENPPLISWTYVRGVITSSKKADFDTVQTFPNLCRGS